MWSKTAGIVLFFVGQTGWSWQAPPKCYRGQIRTKSFGIVEIQKASYCTDPVGTEIVSESCITKNDCMALRSRHRLNSKELRSQAVGTPGFALCFGLKGQGEIIEFTLPAGKWVKLDRCLFTDGSFIDTGSLLELSYRDQ